eukprot:gene13060-27562_t
MKKFLSIFAIGLLSVNLRISEAVKSGNLNVVPTFPQQYSKNGGNKFANTLSMPNEVMYEKMADNDFDQRSSRLGFIRKVYAIFSAQMLGTIAVTAVIMGNDDLEFFLLRNYLPTTVTTGLLSTGILCALVASPKLRHTYPINLALLGVQTLLQAITVGTFSCLFDPKLVCLGTVHTLVAFGAITLYSFQPDPKYDLTTKSSLLLTSTLSLLVGSILALFFKMPLLDNIISAALAILFAGYIAYDTQKIVGDHNALSSSTPDDGTCVKTDCV